MQSIIPYYKDGLLVITHPKIASSWCKKAFLPFDEDNQITTTCYIDENLTLYYDGDDLLENIKHKNNIISTWDSLEKNDSINVIFLYRNPFNHFMSAFIQDFFVFGEESPQLQNILNILENIDIPIDVKNKFLKMYKSNRYDLNKNTFNQFPFVWELVLEKVFEDRMKYPIIYGHFSLWMSFIYGLSKSNKFKNKKIKFLDINLEYLEREISKYIKFDRTKSGPLFSHKFTFEKMTQIIEKSKYKDYIYKSLENEMSIYNNLKSNE
jgi:hypothetical protein